MRAVDGGDDEGIVELLRRGVTVCAKVLLMRRVTAESEASASPHLTVARGRSSVAATWLRTGPASRSWPFCDSVNRTDPGKSRGSNDC